MTRRPCWVEIDTQAFESNVRLLMSQCAAEVLAVVKADAYGHGLTICAPAAVDAGARWLGVTTVEEGVAARAVCPAAEILVISGPYPFQGDAAVANRLTVVVWEPWQVAEMEQAARAVGRAAGSLAVHLEIDTGMSRQGIRPEEIASFLLHFEGDSPLRLDGVMTHLFAAEESDRRTTLEQLEALEPVLARVRDGGVRKAGLRPMWLNVGNSAATLDAETTGRLQELAAKYGMRLMLRPGLALYGVAPEFAPEEPATVAELRGLLRPVLSWKTRVVGLRRIEAGTLVGYNGSFVATEPMRVALLAVGYADGYRRSLGNRAEVLVGGQRVPVIGRVSMDQVTVDVTDVPGVAAGDEVVLLGRQGQECIRVEELAGLEGTIVWEVFTSIGARVERRAV